MEISRRALETHLQELRWAQQELMCVLPATVHNNVVSTSIDECVQRLNFALHNLDRNVKRLTNKKKKENEHVQQKTKR